MVKQHTRSMPWLSEPQPMASSQERLAWYAGVVRWAPSKHNSQPWRCVVEDGILSVWADPGRMLPDTDPHRRELTISCGAALELACIAARGIGHRPQVRLLPRGPGGPVAHLVEAGTWETGDEDRALLAAIPRRRTDRGPLDGQALPAQAPFLLQSAAADLGVGLRLVRSPGERATLARLVERADRVLVQQPHVDEETRRWLRELDDDRPDGVPADHTRGAAASYRAEFVQRDFSTPESRPAQDRPGPDRALVGVLHSPGDSPRDWVDAGRGLTAVLLRATVLGANASYLNQPVEHPPTRVELRDVLSLSGVPQLVLRVGVGDAAIPPPPRRQASDVMYLP
jgi:hypothetical protein